MPGVIAGRNRPLALTFLLLTLVGCPGADSLTGSDSPRAPRVQVVNSSGARIDHVTVLNVTFAQNLSYNTTLYGTDNGTYCGDGCSTGFVEIAEGTHPVTVAQSNGGAAEAIGSVGAFQNDNSYAVNIRRLGAGYCAELWKRTDTGPVFNQDGSKVRIASYC